MLTVNDIEMAVAEHFGIRTHIIVPNVSWGLGVHECDLLSVTKAGYATEIEIKVSRQDIKADFKKRHAHKSSKIKYLYFAIPDVLRDSIEFIPDKAGIFIISKNNYGGIICIEERKPVACKFARKLTDKEILKVATLGTMRIWNMKKVINTQNKEIMRIRDGQMVRTI
jgi:hypothetical protein